MATNARGTWDVVLDDDSEPAFSVSSRLRQDQLYAYIVAWATDNGRTWEYATATNSLDGGIIYFINKAVA